MRLLSQFGRIKQSEFSCTKSPLWSFQGREGEGRKGELKREDEKGWGKKQNYENRDGRIKDNEPHSLRDEGTGENNF